MAAQKRKAQGINLLPTEEFAKSTSGRVLNWLLSSFRFIVIITELVVMAAFISRFFLDAKSNDLSDAITAKKAVIVSFSKIENDFRDTQQRLSIFSSLSTDNKKLTTIVSKIAQSLPTDVSLITLSYRDSKFIIKGASFSEQSIAQLMSNLKATSEFSHIALTDVDLRETNTFINFSLTLNLGG